jgi:hypothetical protein
MVEPSVDLKSDVYELVVEELDFVKIVIINKKFMFWDELLDWVRCDSTKVFL